MAAEATLFELASRVFDGWSDPETHLMVLRILPVNAAELAGGDGDQHWLTKYHQHPCFLEGGRKVHLRRLSYQKARGTSGSYVVDLTTGLAELLLPEHYHLITADAGSSIVLCMRGRKKSYAVVLYDLATGAELAAFEPEPEWYLAGAQQLANPRQALVGQYQGRFGGHVQWREHCKSRLFLLDADGPARLLFDEDGVHCNHMQGNPAEPEIFSFDRWPAPKPERKVEVVIHIRDLAGTFEEPLPQLDGTVRPGALWGGQRDHYVWTPDGRRIASYFTPIESDSDDHFDFGWWLSVLDWRTGEDLAAEYPPHRWGGHFQASPDSKYVVSCGGKEFQHLYAVNIEELRQGWNERVLCRYPQTLEEGSNRGPFHHPFVLPDQSGVLFTAGWPGPEFGVYLVEWPADLS